MLFKDISKKSQCSKNDPKRDRQYCRALTCCVSSCGMSGRPAIEAAVRQWRSLIRAPFRAETLQQVHQCRHEAAGLLLSHSSRAPDAGGKRQPQHRAASARHPGATACVYWGQMGKRRRKNLPGAEACSLKRLASSHKAMRGTKALILKVKYC